MSVVNQVSVLLSSLNTPLIVFYSVVYLLNAALTFVTWKIGNERKDNAPVVNSFDLFQSILPDLSKSVVLFVLLMLVDYTPFLFGPDVVKIYSQYFLFILFIRHAINILTITGPSPFRKCSEKFSWKDYVFGHCYESGFDQTFAYAVLLGLILLSMGYNSLYCYIYIAAVFIGLLALRSVSSKDLFITGLIISNLFFVNAPQYLPDFIQDILSKR